MPRWIPATLLALPLALIGCDPGEKETPETTAETTGPAAPNGAAPAGAAASAEQAQPLDAGEPAPAATLRSMDDQPVPMDARYAQGPTMLVFYRGGWCPYCNAHLGELNRVEPMLRDLGINVLAVSPDRPAKLRESREKHELSYELLSDSAMELARAFGLAFTVDEETLAKLRQNDMDIEEASGEDHRMLPVPAVFLIDREGVIQFAHANPDYTDRLDPEAILDAAREIVGSDTEPDPDDKAPAMPELPDFGS